MERTACQRCAEAGNEEMSATTAVERAKEGGSQTNKPLMISAAVKGSHT